MTKKRMVTLGLLFCGAALVIYGVLQGNFIESMQKGMGICWECIGLG